MLYKVIISLMEIQKNNIPR